MAKTISIDEETYSELVRLTGSLMEKTGEQVSIGQVARLAVAYLKSCFINFPRLEDEVLELIGFEKEKLASIHEVTSDWFDKRFLEIVLGITPPSRLDDSADLISELRKSNLRKIFGRHRGKMYEAEITENSKVRTLHDGKVHDSLSAAASEIRGYQENGWRFWKYKYRERYVPLMTWRDTFLRKSKASS